jgi:hypothetical protein
VAAKRIVFKVLNTRALTEVGTEEPSRFEETLKRIAPTFSEEEDLASSVVVETTLARFARTTVTEARAAVLAACVCNNLTTVVTGGGLLHLILGVQGVLGPKGNMIGC